MYSHNSYLCLFSCRGYSPSPSPSLPHPLPQLKPSSQPPSSPSPSRTHQLHQKLTVFIREEMQQGVQGIFYRSQISKHGTIGDYSINSNTFVSVNFVYYRFWINTRRGVSVLSFFYLFSSERAESSARNFCKHCRMSDLENDVVIYVVDPFVKVKTERSNERKSCKIRAGVGGGLSCILSNDRFKNEQRNRRCRMIANTN